VRRAGLKPREVRGCKALAASDVVRSNNRGRSDPSKMQKHDIDKLARFSELCRHHQRFCLLSFRKHANPCIYPLKEALEGQEIGTAPADHSAANPRGKILMWQAPSRDDRSLQQTRFKNICNSRATGWGAFGATAYGRLKRKKPSEMGCRSTG